VLGTKELRAEALELIELARKLGPEGEGIEFADREWTMEELVQLRSHLSAMRTGIDIVNSGLARYWDETFPGEKFMMDHTEWSVGKTRVRRVVDPDLFIEWVASLDAEQLATLVNPNRLVTVVKTSGMSPAERDTHLSEEYSQTSGISIKSKEKPW